MKIQDLLRQCAANQASTDGKTYHPCRAKSAENTFLTEGPYMKQLILKITHRMWNREISRILCRAYEKQIINSYQL